MLYDDFIPITILPQQVFVCREAPDVVITIGIAAIILSEVVIGFGVRGVAMAVWGLLRPSLTSPAASRLGLTAPVIPTIAGHRLITSRFRCREFATFTPIFFLERGSGCACLV